MSQDTEDEYILGVDQAELRRLRSQHQIWVEQMHSLVQRARIGSGDVVLDLGCGPGATTFELAHFVGTTGRVYARDASAKFIEILRHEAKRLGLANIEAGVCLVEELALEPASLDGAYGRWILSWPPDVECVVSQIATALRPGGVYAMQEYLDWGAMKILPRSRVFDRAVDACMESWRLSGGTINISEEIPAMARKAGLEVEHFGINARSGQVGTLIWNWLDEFFEVYLVRLVEQGGFAQADYDAFLTDWRERGAEGSSIVIAPVVADIVLRKPK